MANITADFTAITNVIQQLDDNPNENDLTAAELKAKFDEGAGNVVSAINNSLIPAINTRCNAIEDGVFDRIYPVGSIYMSINSTNPGTLFGGTWEQIKDKFLLSAGSTYTAGSTGGAATVTLTTNQIPSHSHDAGTSGFTVLGADGSLTYKKAASGSGVSNLLAAASSGTNVNRTGIANTGGGQAHNNMPPYLAVYVWKRVS